MQNANINNIKLAISESSKQTRIYVGCDSKRYSDGLIKFATVVILHIDGNNGCKLFSFIEDGKDYCDVKNPKMRLVHEAYKATDIAAQLIDVIGDRHFELHLDLNTNPKYKSSAAVKEATGYVMGVLGLHPKLKPYAWASSNVADKLITG